MKIVAIIPHFQHDEKLASCIEHVKACEIPEGYEIDIYIHDNNKNNIGFTRAVNAGLSAYPGAWGYWILNQDCYPREHALASLVHRLNADAGLGIVSSMLLDSANPDHIVHGGTVNAVPGTHKSGYISLGELQEFTYERWVTFGSVLIRGKTIVECGHLDPNYFLICSDSDYCYHCRNYGWKVGYEPASQVLHDEQEGVSRRTNKSKRPTYIQRRMSLDQLHFISKGPTGNLYEDLDLEIF